MMTTTEIAALTGNELDAQIAIACFGWRWYASRTWHGDGSGCSSGKVWQPWHRFIAPPAWIEVHYNLNNELWKECVRESDGTEPLWKDWGKVAPLPDFSTDANAMLQLLAWLQTWCVEHRKKIAEECWVDGGPWVQLQGPNPEAWAGAPLRQTQWLAGIARSARSVDYEGESFTHLAAFGGTPAEAVARACLVAVFWEKQQ